MNFNSKEITLEGKCTICGNKQTFYQWDDTPVDSENVITAKNSSFVERYCYKCGTMRVFQK